MIVILRLLEFVALQAYVSCFGFCKLIVRQDNLLNPNHFEDEINVGICQANFYLNSALLT